MNTFFFVTPAKAGVQAVNHFLRIMFKAWMPAFAGVTVLFLAGPVLAHEGEDSVLKKIGFDQKLNSQIPPEAVFTDEAGKPVKLGDYLGKKPALLTLVYYECPMLCTLSLNGLSKALRVMSFSAGKEFEIITVSFEPKENAALALAKKTGYIQYYERPGTEKGWHFLVGNQTNIDKLTDSVGFHYTYDKESKQWAHPVGVIVLTPEGKISRYFFDVEYSPLDLKLALMEAAKGDIGDPIDKALLYCYHYDPATGKYGLLILRVLRGAGILSVLIVALFIFIMIRQERKKPHA